MYATLYVRYITFHTFIMHCYIKRGVKYKVHQVQRKQIDYFMCYRISVNKDVCDSRKCAGHWSIVPSISDRYTLHHTAGGCAWSATSCNDQVNQFRAPFLTLDT